MFHDELSYLYVSCSGSNTCTSVREEREIKFACNCVVSVKSGFCIFLVLGIGCVIYGGIPWSFHIFFIVIRLKH